MKWIKFVVLASGILGLASFFMPLVAVSRGEIRGTVSAFQLVAGLEVVKKAVDDTEVTTAAAARDKKEASDTLGAVKAIVLALYAPALLIAIIGLVGVLRRKFERVAGSFTLLLGLVGMGVASLLLAAAKDKDVTAAAQQDPTGSGMYVMFLAAVLGTVGGLLALIKPDRG